MGNVTEQTVGALVIKDNHPSVWEQSSQPATGRANTQAWLVPLCSIWILWLMWDCRQRSHLVASLCVCVFLPGLTVTASEWHKIPHLQRRKLRPKEIFLKVTHLLNWQWTLSSSILNPTYFYFWNTEFLSQYRVELGLDYVPRFHLVFKMGKRWHCFQTIAPCIFNCPGERYPKLAIL